ncbi:nuclear transport factor 2 family protein [Sphingobacterium sp. DR205]|uniref:nuclear transport factor 2 family protein n=1 Tax=Sphingobacterium sp. DR205 TaxID=2713573 RepID=UPI0013E49B75|nr:nuclear transport factor 2 family protein [Sphingobacterium sp. DR205]QIH35650.1 nuclear transport factor 2 family protein [Sphingobacterium sp. DR205]
MKTLVKTYFAAALITVSTFAMAADKPTTKSSKATVNLSTADMAFDRYIAVTTEGQSAGVEQLFTTDFSQKIQSENAVTNNRTEVIRFFKKQAGEKLNCNVSAQIVEKSADYMIAKVTLKFEGFTMTDLVTLVREGNSWKVSKSIDAYQ